MSKTTLIHTCDGCGKKGEWTDSWQSYGSLMLKEDGKWLEACSPECREKITENRDSIWLSKYGESLRESEKKAVRLH